MNESTRSAGEEREVRLRQEQKEGGGGEEDMGHDDRLTFKVQGGAIGELEREKGGGGRQSEGEFAGGGGRMEKRTWVEIICRADVSQQDFIMRQKICWKERKDKCKSVIKTPARLRPRGPRRRFQRSGRIH